jgi:hypothetical protein
MGVTFAAAQYQLHGDGRAVGHGQQEQALCLRSQSAVQQAMSRSIGSRRVSST